MSASKSNLLYSLNKDWDRVVKNRRNLELNQIINPTLPALITKAASKQTYYTIRFLVDRDRVPDAYRTYAYFRWVDDQLDEHLSNQMERIAFIQRQQNLMNRCYQREPVHDESSEEGILVDLIQSDQEDNSGLQVYIRHMMAVMVFDAERRGKLISQQQLDCYTQHLAIAVTEAMHYFIGHGHFAPNTEERYCAVTGAHIIHMLRDTVDDVAAGYFNVPCEFLEAHHIDIKDVDSEPYRIWVKDRIQQARNCFNTGKAYLAQVESRRCRIAGYAYLARFQSVLEAITYEGYQVQPRYTDHTSLRSGFQMAKSLLAVLTI